MSIVVGGTIIPTSKGSIRYGGIDLEQVDVVKNGSRTTVWKASPGIWENGKHVPSVVTYTYNQQFLFIPDSETGCDGFKWGLTFEGFGGWFIDIPKGKGISKLYIELPNRMKNSTISWGVHYGNRVRDIANSVINTTTLGSSNLPDIVNDSTYYGYQYIQENSSQGSTTYSAKLSLSSVDSKTKPCIAIIANGIPGNRPGDYNWCSIRTLRFLNSADKIVYI